MRPDFQEEKKLWRKGCKFVACIDEVGRGCLAGPATACAVIVAANPKPPAPNLWDWCGANKIHPQKLLRGIKDSKQLLPKKREEFYRILTRHPGILWAVASVSPKIIDKINIFEATKLAMKKAVQKLSKRILINLRHTGDRQYAAKSVNKGIDFLILDGKIKLDLPIPQKAIVKADEKVFSCAAASIIAKVTRDKMMARYHKKYPQYRFDLHKGYGTRLHLESLKKYGLCPIHRKSFRPIFQITNFQYPIPNKNLNVQ